MQLQIETIIERLSEAFGEGVRVSGGTPERMKRVITALLTDSRSLTLPASTLFFALRSERNDGHRFMSLLYKAGVRSFVVDEIPASAEKDAIYIKVPDTLRALQAVGHLARTSLSGTLLAITGSRGKTTLKEWIFQLMEPLAETIRSPRSYNSQIGVPLSLWQIGDTTGLAVIEAGVSREGEMKRLADMIAPDSVIVTNIGDEHSEGFGSLAHKAAEKALLASPASVKHLIYNSDYIFITEALAPYREGREVWDWSRHGESPAAIIITGVTDIEEGALMSYRCGEVSGTVKLPGASDEDIENGANALAFMLSRGIAAEVIEERFSILCPVGTRLQVIEGVNGCSLIVDSYTSDFSSLIPALDFQRRHATEGLSPIVIVSDLRHESGEGDVYGRIADLFRSFGVKRVIGIGEGFVAHADKFDEDFRGYATTAKMLEEVSPSDFSDEIILLKGAPGFHFNMIREMLEARTHETVLEVNLDAVVRNFNYFRSHLPGGTGLIAMVKAGGYGAGSLEIAKTLQDAGAAYLAVAVLDEGIELRKNGITMPVMVMNPKVVNYKQMFAHSLEPEIYSAEMLEDVIREARKNGIREYPVHIKLDTGMHRMGFIGDELPELMDRLCSQDYVVAKSVFSHLATADCPEMNDYTELQLKRFEKYSGYMLSRYSRPILRHVLNSAGILRYSQYHYDMARLGIGLYGVRTLPEDMEGPLSPVSSLRTVIIAIREWEAGETIGYGRRGVLTRRSRIATIPIGYADGMNRHFGRGAISVRVNGKDAPTVGNICMDACMIDVTDVDCRVGDAVEIFGAEADVQRLADVLDTIPYEILTSVSPRVKRVYYRE